MRAFIVMRSLLWVALAACPSLAATAASADAPGGTQLAQSQSAAAGGATALSPEAQSLYDAMQHNKPPAELVERLYDNPGNARATMINYLASGGTSPEERARRAAVLAAGILDSRRAVASPETRDQLIDALMRLASEVVCSTRCIGTEIAEGYVPPASSFAYDYGGAASQLAKGFTLVTPDSDMFVGQVRDFEGLGTGALLYDANSGMTRIVLNVPNGSYVLRLFLPQGGTGQI
jgi:hypothetical protein